MTTDEIIAAIDSGWRSDEDRFRIAEAAMTIPYDLEHVGKGRQAIFHSGDGPLNDCFRTVISDVYQGLYQVCYNKKRQEEYLLELSKEKK